VPEPIKVELCLLWRYVWEVVLNAGGPTTAKLRSILALIAPPVALVIGSKVAWDIAWLPWLIALVWVLLFAGFVNPFQFWRGVELRRGSPLEVTRTFGENLSPSVGPYWKLEVKNLTDHDLPDVGGTLVAALRVADGFTYSSASFQWSSLHGQRGQVRMTIPKRDCRNLDVIYLDPSKGKHPVDRPMPIRLIYAGTEELVESHQLEPGEYRFLIAIQQPAHDSLYVVCGWQSDGFESRSALDLLHVGLDEIEARRILEAK